MVKRLTIEDLDKIYTELNIECQTYKAALAYILKGNFKTVAEVRQLVELVLERGGGDD